MPCPYSCVIADIAPEGVCVHSLRSGFETSAAKAGVAILKIRAAIGERSDAILAPNIRHGELFAGSAAGMLL